MLTMSIDQYDPPYDEFLGELLADVEFFARQICESDSQFLRRAFCRTVFQFVDGMSSLLKQDVTHWESPELIGDDVYLAVQDLKRIQNSKESSKVVKKYKGIAENLFFAVDTYAWTSGLECDLRTEPSWQPFLACLIIRNRITHPKNHMDMYISDLDLRAVMEVYLWLVGRLRELLLSSAESRITQIESMCRGWLEKHGDTETGLEVHLLEAEEMRKMMRQIRPSSTTSSIGLKE